MYDDAGDGAGGGCGANGGCDDEHWNMTMGMLIVLMEMMMMLSMVTVLM